MNNDILKATVVFAVSMTSLACSGEATDLEFQSEEHVEVGTIEQALFDSAVMDTTAKNALLAAATATLASALDPLSGFQQVEYCGHVIKKANNAGYRATLPETDYEIMFCQPAAPALGAGESRVGFYHTHTPASDPNFSPQDIQASEASGRKYYVISTLNGCARRYNPQNNTNVQLACFPGQF